MFTNHLRLIGKRIVDFLLVLIELFSLGVYGWGAMGEYRLKIGVFAPAGSALPKISGRRVINVCSAVITSNIIMFVCSHVTVCFSFYVLCLLCLFFVLCVVCCLPVEEKLIIG